MRPERRESTITLPAKLNSTVIHGRSSSHFTRIARIFAVELEVPHQFRIVRDLNAQNQGDYAGNPALSIPVLISGSAQYFGTLNVCRKLAGLSACRTAIVWPEHLETPTQQNALELTLQAMTAQVSLIMSKRGGVDPSGPYALKLRERLEKSVQWLERWLQSETPPLSNKAELSFLDVCLFCLVTHLEFTDCFDSAPHPALVDFITRFGQRPSTKQTTFQFDR